MPSLYTSLPHWLFTGVNNSEVEILDYDPTVSSIYFYTVQYSELWKKNVKFKLLDWIFGYKADQAEI